MFTLKNTLKISHSYPFLFHIHESLWALGCFAFSRNSYRKDFFFFFFCLLATLEKMSSLTLSESKEKSKWNEKKTGVCHKSHTGNYSSFWCTLQKMCQLDSWIMCSAICEMQYSSRPQYLWDIVCAVSFYGNSVSPQQQNAGRRER